MKNHNWHLKSLELNNNEISTCQKLWNIAKVEKISNLWYTLEHNADKEMNDFQLHVTTWAKIPGT